MTLYICLCTKSSMEIAFYRRMEKKNKGSVLERPGQCPELNAREMCGEDLKLAVQVRKSTNNAD